MRFIVLTILLMMLTLTTSSAEETTTNNLISLDFSTGWSGTATGRHGNGTVAAVDDTYIKSDDVSLKDDANLTEAQLQDGFTSNHSFKYWHWNNYNSTVTSKVTITKADGEVTTQIRTYNSTGCGYINCGSFQSGSDTLSISRNTQTDFDINVRYDFTDTSNSTTHYSVDLKEPSLTITYESEPIDQSIQEELIEIQEELTEIVKTLLIETFKEESIAIETLPEPQELEIITKEIVAEVMEEIKESFEPQMLMATFTEEEPEFIEEATEIIEEIYEEEAPVSMATEKEEVVQEEEKEEVVSVQEEEQEKSEVKTQAKEEESSSKESTTEVVSAKNNSKQKKIQSKKTINISKVMDKVDAQIKDIAKNLAIKNIIKLAAMVGDQASLSVYSNKEFYLPKDIYLDQLNIFDPRLIYNNVSLNNYIVNDKVFIKERKLNDINIRKQRLLIEIQELKNG